MIIAIALSGLLYMFSGSHGGPAMGPIVESISASTHQLKHVIVDRSQRDDIEAQIKHLEQLQITQNQQLQTLVGSLRSESQQHVTTEASLQSLIDRYADDAKTGDAKMLDAYFKLRASMTAEQWTALYGQ